MTESDRSASVTLPFDRETVMARVPNTPYEPEAGS
jgi:hypothetical protein